MALRRKQIALLLASVTLLVGLGCDGMKEDPLADQQRETPKTVASSKAAKPCDPDAVPPDKPNLGAKRYVTIYGCVEDGFQPIELFTGARDQTTGEYGEHTEPSANTKVHYVVGYDKGHKVILDVKLQPSKTGSQHGMLYISDGPLNRKTLYISGSWRIKTSFTVAR